VAWCSRTRSAGALATRVDSDVAVPCCPLCLSALAAHVVPLLCSAFLRSGPVGGGFELARIWAAFRCQIFFKNDTLALFVVI
jgi:hypothetical protein